jgi:hypothetical protein
MLATLKGERLVIGFRRRARTNDEMYFGVVKMSREEQAQSVACIDELMAKIK